jgi:hypothetical protein
MQKYINLQKEKNPPLKETKILQDMHNSW